MTYPKTILNSKIRKLINIFLVLSFFIISPIIILYTTGYRYDFQTGQVSQTGVIGIDVEPENVQVFLNGIKIQEKIPIRITNLAPDVYSIHLELEGYYSWDKDIDVKSKKTTFVNNVLLYKKSNPTPVLDSFKNITNIDFSHDSRYALFTSKDKNIYEVKLYEINKKETTTIIRITSEFEPNISWSPFGNSAVITTQDEKKTTFYILSTTIPDNTNSFIFDTKLLDKNFQWKNSTLPTIFVKENHNIKQLGLTGKKIVASNITANNWFVDEKNNVWIINNNEKLLNTTISKQIFTPFKLSKRKNKIININNSRAILSSQNETTIINLYTRKIEKIKTNQFIFNQNNNSWISWSPWEIWETYENGDVRLINRTSERIKTVNPLNEFGVLLLASQNSINAFDTNFLLSHKLLENITIKEISINQKGQKIFFWGVVNEEENLFELEY